MRVRTPAEVKQAWDSYAAEAARRTHGLTALQRQALGSHLEHFPLIECGIVVFDVWPGSGTSYPHPLNGRPDATALVTGFLARSEQPRRWWPFAPESVRAIALIHDHTNRESLLKLTRGQEILVQGLLVWLNESEYLVGGGHPCFGESVGARFTFRVENAKLSTRTSIGDCHDIS